MAAASDTRTADSVYPSPSTVVAKNHTIPRKRNVLARPQDLGSEIIAVGRWMEPRFPRKTANSPSSVDRVGLGSGLRERRWSRVRRTDQTSRSVRLAGGSVLSGLRAVCD
ncbi:hypothetical protein N8I77_001517 [Diaporthe amygdali]|uniref:Uncharacterized protein n=1 Tax=Phomopsis amygdali TaxID=1214568 RepID=A0AAD9SRQ8_PHOAM|nr:hypothetical protein N8I77_001517 [Diaporthe amygdali]